MCLSKVHGLCRTLKDRLWIVVLKNNSEQITFLTVMLSAQFCWWLGYISTCSNLNVCCKLQETCLWFGLWGQCWSKDSSEAFSFDDWEYNAASTIQQQQSRPETSTDKSRTCYSSEQLTCYQGCYQRWWCASKMFQWLHYRCILSAWLWTPRGVWLHIWPFGNFSCLQQFTSR